MSAHKIFNIYLMLLCNFGQLKIYQFVHSWGKITRAVNEEKLQRHIFAILFTGTCFSIIQVLKLLIKVTARFALLKKHRKEHD